LAASYTALLDLHKRASASSNTAKEEEEAKSADEKSGDDLRLDSLNSLRMKAREYEMKLEMQKKKMES